LVAQTHLSGGLDSDFDTVPNDRRWSVFYQDKGLLDGFHLGTNKKTNDSTRTQRCPPGQYSADGVEDQWTQSDVFCIVARILQRIESRIYSVESR
jgi:hypothetical protein